MKTRIVKHSIIRKSPVQRIDAAFQLSDGVQTRNIIDNLPFPKTTCGNVASRIFHAGRWKRVYVTNEANGITLLGSSSMLKADMRDEKLVSKKYTEDIQDKLLEKGWILISCSGTIGNTVYTNSGHAGKLASQDVIRLLPNDILGGGYIYAYLSSKYGYSMLTQGTFGAVIQHIEPANVESIPIPIFSSEFIASVDSMIKCSAELRDQASVALSRVHALFEERIHIKIEKIKNRVSISNILSSKGQRFDAEYMISDSKAIYDAISKSLSYMRLRELVSDIYTEGIFKREYVENGVPFMMGSEILKAVPTASKFLSKKQAKNKSELFVKKDWILITCSGAVGDVAISDTQLCSFIFTHDLIRVKPKDQDTQYYVFGFLSSKMGKDLMSLFRYGSVIQHVDANQIAETPIPIFEDIKPEVIRLTRDYVKKFEEAKILELKAIAMVEEEIEKWN